MHTFQELFNVSSFFLRNESNATLKFKLGRYVTAKQSKQTHHLASLGIGNVENLSSDDFSYESRLQIGFDVNLIAHTYHEKLIWQDGYCPMKTSWGMDGYCLLTGLRLESFLCMNLWTSLQKSGRNIVE